MSPASLFIFRECLERALSIYNERYQHHHPSVAIALTNLGAVMRSLGETERSKELFEQALNMEEHLYEPTHPSVSKISTSTGSNSNRIWFTHSWCGEGFGDFIHWAFEAGLSSTLHPQTIIIAGNILLLVCPPKVPPYHSWIYGSNMEYSMV